MPRPKTTRSHPPTINLKTAAKRKTACIPYSGCRPNKIANGFRYFKTPLSKAFIRIVATRSRAISS